MVAAKAAMGFFASLLGVAIEYNSLHGSFANRNLCTVRQRDPMGLDSSTSRSPFRLPRWTPPAFLPADRHFADLRSGGRLLPPAAATGRIPQGAGAGVFRRGDRGRRETDVGTGFRLPSGAVSEPPATGAGPQGHLREWIDGDRTSHLPLGSQASSTPAGIGTPGSPGTRHSLPGYAGDPRSGGAARLGRCFPHRRGEFPTSPDRHAALGRFPPDAAAPELRARGPHLSARSFRGACVPGRPLGAGQAAHPRAAPLVPPGYLLGSVAPRLERRPGVAAGDA